MVKPTLATINLGSRWDRTASSVGVNVMSFFFALAMHVPLMFMRFDAHKKQVDHSTERIVSIDYLENKPRPAEVAPPPPVEEKKPSFMEKFKSLMKPKEPPPPAPMEKKPLPDTIANAPKPIALEAKLNTPDKIQPALATKSGFKTTADPQLIQEQKLAMAGVPGIAPLSAKKLGTLDDRTAVKTNKGNFQVSSKDSLKSIGGDGAGLAGAAGGPAITIRTGNQGTRENFSAPTTQKADKGRLGAVSGGNLGGGPQLGLRDEIIKRDAAAGQIAIGTGGGQAGGVPGGIPGGTGKKDAGRFQGGIPGGVAGGTGTGLTSVGSKAPAIAPVAVKPKEKKSMFTITGPLKDRKIEKQIPPEYPAWAQEQGISASVILEFTVDPDGVVKNNIVIRKTSGYPKLDETAIKALRQWKFAPLPGGENRDEVGQIVFNYSLS